MSYTKIGEISEACRQQLLDALPGFGQVGGVHPEQEANYQTTPKMLPAEYPVLFGHPDLACIPAMRERAIAVRAEPDGKLHKHIHDLERDRGKTRYQVVLETNDHCTSRNGDMTAHLDDRGIYLMEPFLEHESWNHGASDRTHLVFVTCDV